MPVADLIAGGFDIGITFDDSIVEDTEANINRGLMLINNRVLSKYKFLTDKKYGFCYTPEQYEEEMARISKESTVGELDLDVLGGVE